MRAGRFGTHRRSGGLLVGLIAVAALIALVVASSGSARARGSCYGKPATITGTNGADNIKLTARKDIVDAKGGNDTIQAASIPSSRGRDIVCGGPGNDKITGNRDNNILIGGPGKDKIKGGPGGDLIVGDNANPKGSEGGPTSSDNLNGTGGKDFMVGDNYASGNASGASHDTMVGLGGDDTMVGDDASRTGNATGGKPDHMGGANNNDLVVGDSYSAHGTASGSGDDTLNAGPGDDLEVGDNYSVDGHTSGGGEDILAGPDGGEAGFTCKPRDPCDDTFYGDNYVASCARNASPQANAVRSVIKCEAEQAPGGAADIHITTDQGNDFINGGPPDDPKLRGQGDVCAGGSGNDTGTRCELYPRNDVEHEIPYP